MRGYNSGIISNIALFYSHRGNKEKELEYYQKLIQLTPLTGKICHYYGDYLIKGGNQEEGTRYMKKGIEIDPDYYGGRYDALEDFFNAKKCYKKGIKLKNYQMYKLYSSSKLAFCYYQLNNYPKSIQQYFTTCDFKSIQGYSIEDDIFLSCQIMKLMPQQQAIQIIEKQDGLQLIPRFSQFAEESKVQSLKQLFLQKLEIHRHVLFLTIYKKLIVKHLMFQSKIIHWDMFID
ncbi:hypothetical protein ABPG72_004669 [Tetrahymena utriculariae]